MKLVCGGEEKVRVACGGVQVVKFGLWRCGLCPALPVVLER